MSRTACEHDREGQPTSPQNKEQGVCDCILRGLVGESRSGVKTERFSKSGGRRMGLCLCLPRDERSELYVVRFQVYGAP